MPDYTVKAVQGPRPWESQHGKFNGYVLTLEGQDKVVELNQKEGSPDPQVGQTIDLELSPHPRFENRLKGKKAAAFQGGRGGFGGGPRPEDPKKSAHIARMHAQGVAVHYAGVLQGIGRLPEDFNLAQLKQIVDWFQADARAAKDAA